MKIAILNDIHIGSSLHYEGKVRASSHLVEEVLPSVIDHIIEKHSPDLLVNLGDLIRSERKDLDLERYRRGMRYFQQSRVPVLHTIGNHELKKMSLGDVEGIWEEFGFPQKSYGLKEFESLALIWIGLQFDPNKKAKYLLPEEQFQWLDKVLGEIKKPVLIFSHCALDDHDLEGNYFYETFDARQSRGQFLENQKDIRHLISRLGTVKAVLQAHLHYFHTKVIDNLSYITCPALGDNICGPDIPENIPEIYTLLKFDGRRFSIKAYSRDFSFAGTEF